MSIMISGTYDTSESAPAADVTFIVPVGRWEEDADGLAYVFEAEISTGGVKQFRLYGDIAIMCAAHPGKVATIDLTPD